MNYGFSFLILSKQFNRSYSFLVSIDNGSLSFFIDLLVGGLEAVL